MISSSIQEKALARKEPEHDVCSAVDEIVAEHILRLAELSYRMEIDRGESISALSSKLLTAISITSVALIALLPIASEQEDTILLNSYIVIFALLLCAFLLCLISQYRFRYKTLVSPKEVAAQIIKSNDEIPFLTRTDSAEHFCDSIEESYKSVRKKNGKANILLRIAVVLMLVASGLLLANLLMVWLCWSNS